MYSSDLFVALAALVPAVLAQSVSPCEKVNEQQTAAIRKLDLDSVNPYNIPFLAFFDAETAYQCIASIPINNTEAAAMVEVDKKFLALYSTIPFLKNPPKSYQQPSIDVIAQLNEIAEKANRGNYSNFNQFELDIIAINRGVYDTHFGIGNGPNGLISYNLPYGLVSASVDGKELPQVYVHSDIIDKVSNPSSIVEIEGQNVFTYLQKYAATNAVTNMLDPHADWNQLMYNEATQFGSWGADNKNSMTIGGIQTTSIYNGNSLKGKFSNGTQFEWKYMASSPAQFKSSNITSGEDLFTVYGLAEKQQQEQEEELKKRALANQTTTTPQYVPYSSYPKTPIVTQANFTRGGVVSRYLLSDNATGVLSLPSFASRDDYTESAEEYSVAATEFISQARKAGTKKIVIDLSGNGGGNVMLGYDVFRQFFPKKSPDALSRSRASPLFDLFGRLVEQSGKLVDGSSETEFLQQLHASFANAGDLNTNNTLTADGKHWTSWKDFAGPLEINGDNFTKAWKYDMSLPTNYAPFETYNISGYGTNEATFDEAFSPGDIIILYDGYCGSTCSIFSNLMKNVGGVKSVAVGGIPQSGPMQGVAGTRGSQVRQHGDMAQVAELIRSGLLDSKNGSREALRSKLGVTVAQIEDIPSASQAPWKVSMALNILDQVSTGNLDVPYQFVYEAANCRLFYTIDMIRDVTLLWEAAAKVAGGDTSACVAGSVDGPGSERNKPLVESPGFSYEDIWKNANSTKLLAVNNTSGNDDSESSASRMTMAASVFVVSFLTAWLL
ncbi:unnamed protein product [Clonostachys solani]|uniref:Tail specific protease domain-containing protein n=1 Tax=Clonostachys solani TaxID=160281 RepID=A0A9P0ESI5_9HYPO|nr:unnamed protein product [Clonostachys solani]